MISFRSANSFCCEDISLIENYEAANNDTTQTWDVHHRLETDLGLSKTELIDRNLYYDRPASELIFMTKAEHIKLHNTGKSKSEETKKKQSIAGKKRYKDPKERKKTGDVTRNCPWMNNGIKCARPKTQEEIDHYRELGYNFGRKLNKRK